MSRGGPKPWPSLRSLTAMNGERSRVHATIASPETLDADHEPAVNCASVRSAPKPPSDCPSATTSRRRPGPSIPPSRATSSARCWDHRWTCAVTGSTPARSGGRSQPPAGSRAASAANTGGTWPGSAASQLSTPRPRPSKSRSCSPRTPSDAPIGSSVHCALAGGASVNQSPAHSGTSQSPARRMGAKIWVIGAATVPVAQPYRSASLCIAPERRSRAGHAP